MPLTNDQTILKTSSDLVNQLHAIFGKHPGIRATHARGLLLNGVFTPSKAAASLSCAQHFNQSSTPITVRFSSSTGIPQIPDTDPNANPRGMAIRFNLAEHIHTDIIAHSTPFFPTRTGAEFLEMLLSLTATSPKEGEPSAVEKFFGSHPAALAFAQAPKPAPSSFANEAYYAVNAFKLVDSDGKGTYVRYKIIPTAGIKALSEADTKSKSDSFLFDELPKRLPVYFKIIAQIADEGDTVDDCTVHWPDTRKVVELGKVKVETVIEDDTKVQQKIIFDPVPRIKGVEPSSDPLLEMRANVYLISGKERRSAL